MEDSILDTIKKMLGINSDCDSFDTDIIIGINSAFAVFRQLGIESAHSIDSRDEQWTKVFEDYSEILDLIKSCTYMRVRRSFDPPTSSYVLDSLVAQISELEWRISEYAEGVFDDAT